MKKNYFHVEELDSDLPIYVISNESGINDASAILYSDVMSEVASKLGGNVYLLPSSIHETIAVPVSIRLTVRDLERMVQDVNKDVILEMKCYPIMYIYLTTRAKA